jgi:hypothetical protein
VWFPTDFAAWQEAAGSVSTLSFTEFAQNTYITDQYADLGVLFTNPGPNVVHTQAPYFPIDGSGIDGNDGIELTFSEPIHAVAAHGPGIWRYKAYLGDTLVYTSPFHLSMAGSFAGLVSSTPFDRVQLVGVPAIPPDDPDDVYIDNIYFSTIPGPPTAVALLLGAPGVRRRRRIGQAAVSEGGGRTDD